MPTVLRIGPYRFHFYSDEGSEPPHVHVRAGNGECKYWLDPVALARNWGLAQHQLREIERIIKEHQNFLLEKYREYHRKRSSGGN
jgi:hypothetical protein